MALDNILISPVLSDKDIAITAALAKEIWTHHYVPLVGAGQVNYMLSKFQNEEAIANQIKDNYLYFLLRSSSNLGYLSVKAEDQHLFISKVYVKAEARGRGYGKTLVEKAISVAKEHNLHSLRLTVYKYNLDTIAAYEKMGFIKNREVVADIGNGYVMDDYEMIRLLD